MPESLLDQAQVEAVFEEVGGIGVAQGVDVSAFVDATLLYGSAEGGLQARSRDRAGAIRNEVLRATPNVGGKDPLRGAVGAPVLAEEFQGIHGQRDVAILSALAVDVEQHAVTVDIGDGEPGAFEEPQPAGVIVIRQAR